MTMFSTILHLERVIKESEVSIKNGRIPMGWHVNKIVKLLAEIKHSVQLAKISLRSLCCFGYAKAQSVYLGTALLALHCVIHLQYHLFILVPCYGQFTVSSFAIPPVLYMFSISAHTML